MSAVENPYAARFATLADACPYELGTSEWTPVTSREADAFDRLVGMPIDFARHPAGPGRLDPVDPFHLVALFSNFASELGVPVPTDEHVTMLNYGYDDVTWHRRLAAGSSVRDKITLQRVTQRAPDQYLLAQRHEFYSEGGHDPLLTFTALGLAILL
jgi:acyl dehydratase